MPISVYGIYRDENGYLMVLDSNSHMWGFPGGTVEKSEDVLDTLKREFIEETGRAIVGLPTYYRTYNSQEKTFHLYRINKLSLSDNSKKLFHDISEVRFIKYSEFDELDTFSDVRKAVKDLEHTK